MSHKNDQHVGTRARDGHYYYVLSLILVLCVYSLIRKHAIVGVLGYDNWSMLMATYFENLITDHPYYSTIAKALFLFNGYLYQIPAIYLVSLIALKVSTFLALFLIYRQITINNYKENVAAIVAIFAVLFFTIGGAGRFQFGALPFVKDIDLYIRSWSQLLLLLGLLNFLKHRFFSSSCFFAATCFFHLVNTLNIFFVLVIALLMNRDNERRLTPCLFRLVVPVLIAVLFQVYSMEGLGLKELFSGLDAEGSIREWYQYIYSQDPDDLSLVYLLNGQPGLQYALFQVAGLYFASRLEGIRRIGDFIRHPVISICLASYVYMLLAVIVEILQMPEFVLEKIIMLQPRRVAYLPTMLLSYFITAYIYEYFRSGGKTTTKMFLSIMLFLVWFSIAISLTNDSYTISTGTTFAFFLTSIAVLVGGKYYKSYVERKSKTNIFHDFRVLSAAALLFIAVRGTPYVNAESLDSLRATYLSIEPREYIDYVLLEKKNSKNEAGFLVILGVTDWLKDWTKPEDSYLTFDFGSDEIGFLAAFSGRKNFQSLDLRHYRAPGPGGGLFSTHHDLKSYVFVREYFGKFLGGAVDSITKLDKWAQLDAVQDIVFRFTIDELRKKKSIYGEKFDYVLSKTSMPNLPLPVYYDEGIFIYKVSNYN